MRILPCLLPGSTKGGPTPLAVCEKVREHRAELQSLLDTCGGILVTAPALKSALDFEHCLRELIDICQDYPGGAPRKKVTDGGVFTTTEFQSNLPIAAHTELSYMPKSKPELIAFCCEVSPKSGGMTPVLDMRQVLARLPDDVVSRFSPGICTSLNLPPKLDVYLDSRRGEFRRWQRSWSSFCDDAAAAARKVEEASPEDVVVEWSGSWMQPFVEMPAVRNHMGSMVWTGFWPSYHWAGSAIQALFDLVLHNRTWRQLWVSSSVVLATMLHAFATSFDSFPIMRSLFPRSATPGGMSCKLKSGERICFFDIVRILWVYNKLLIKWHWQPGQFVLLDNHRMGHARTPYDPSDRQVYTAFGARKS